MPDYGKAVVATLLFLPVLISFAVCEIWVLDTSYSMQPPSPPWAYTAPTSNYQVQVEAETYVAIAMIYDAEIKKQIKQAIAEEEMLEKMVASNRY